MKNLIFFSALSLCDIVNHSKCYDFAKGKKCTKKTSKVMILDIRNMNEKHENRRTQENV